MFFFAVRLSKMTGTSDGASEGTLASEEYLPPCREANFFIAPCPRCGRQLRLKTLRYSHVCGRSFNIEQRAEEHQAAAEKALNARMRALEQPRQHRVEHMEQPMAQPIDKKGNYRNLVRF